MTPEMISPSIDSGSVEQQIRIVRVKLGTVLDLLDMHMTSEITGIGGIHTIALGIHAEVDQMLEKIRLLSSD